MSSSHGDVSEARLSPDLRMLVFLPGWTFQTEDFAQQVINAHAQKLKQIVDHLCSSLEKVKPAETLVLSPVLWQLRRPPHA